MTTDEKHEQTMTALQKANRIRLDRAALKRKIRAGDVDLADLISPDAEIPECLRSASVGEALSAQRRWGAHRARRLLIGTYVAETRRLDALTRRERGVIVARLLGTDKAEVSAAA